MTTLLDRFPGNPLGITWNRGVATTTNDYFAVDALKLWSENPNGYERALRSHEPGADPVAPEAHFVPLLGEDFRR